MWTIVITFLVFIVTLLFVFNWQKHGYWKAKGVPTPPFLPLLGHFSSLYLGYRWENLDKMYKDLKSTGYWGVYVGTKPEFFICDPSLIRNILVKDTEHFVDRRSIKFSNNESYFNEMLIVVEGEEWKALRSLVTPTFTSGKIKAMFPLIEAKVDDLLKQCEEGIERDSYVEAKALVSYYTMDVIGTCSFGIDTHCLENKENSPFVKHATQFTILKFGQLLKFIIILASPKLFQALGLQFNDASISKFFNDVVDETVALRRKSGAKRGDFLDLMMEALDQCEADGSKAKYPMSMNTVVGQSVLFLLAGFDTSANTLSFVVYLLAKHPDTQVRLRKELQKIIEADGELNYQNIMEAQYLDACLSETLRLYAPAHFIERACTKKYKIPGSNVEIPEKMMVVIPVWSIHRDPEFWEDPCTFSPDRFLPENKGNIKPYTYLPFGQGPRNCIGMRFAQLEAKLAIAKLCLTFEMELRPGFSEMKLEKTFNSLRPDENGVQLALKKIRQ